MIETGNWGDNHLMDNFIWVEGENNRVIEFTNEVSQFQVYAKYHKLT